MRPCVGRRASRADAVEGGTEAGGEDDGPREALNGGCEVRGPGSAGPGLGASEGAAGAEGGGVERWWGVRYDKLGAVVLSPRRGLLRLKLRPIALMYEFGIVNFTESCVRRITVVGSPNAC